MTIHNITDFLAIWDRSGHGLHTKLEAAMLLQCKEYSIQSIVVNFLTGKAMWYPIMTYAIKNPYRVEKTFRVGSKMNGSVGFPKTSLFFNGLNMKDGQKCEFMGPWKKGQRPPINHVHWYIFMFLGNKVCLPILIHKPSTSLRKTDYSKINIFPYECSGQPKWPFHRKVKGKLRIIIWTNLNKALHGFGLVIQLT